MIQPAGGSPRITAQDPACCRRPAATATNLLHVPPTQAGATWEFFCFKTYVFLTLMIQPAGAGLRIPHKAKPSCVGRLLLQARGYRHKSSTWAPHPGGSHLGVFVFPYICVRPVHDSTCCRKPRDHGPGPSLLPQARGCSHAVMLPRIHFFS